VIGIFGYRWIHHVMQATAIVVGISLVIMLIQGLRYGSLPAAEMTWARPPAGLFLAGVALLVIDMLSFGPFVSDYTRYLPVRTNGRRLFWAIYAGCSYVRPFPAGRLQAGWTGREAGRPGRMPTEPPFGAARGSCGMIVNATHKNQSVARGRFLSANTLDHARWAPRLVRCVVSCLVRVR
jgi:hypothetical protein